MASHQASQNNAGIRKRNRKRNNRKQTLAEEERHSCSRCDLTGSNALVNNTRRRQSYRFKGMSVEEVVKRTLPDLLSTDLDIVFIGINPGLYAAYKGHYYPSATNHFWKCLHLSGLIGEQLCSDDDGRLQQWGIGLTDMVKRTTRTSADVTHREMQEGAQILLRKLQQFKPKIAVFNGKKPYKAFSGRNEFNYGRQQDFISGTNTQMWVLPSSSARNAQLPRAEDKLPFYKGLKKFRDYLNGDASMLEEDEVVFSPFPQRNPPPNGAPVEELED